MPKLRSLGPLVRTLDTSTTRLPPKQKDPVYNSPAFQVWRMQVVARAGGRCEALEHGRRCTKAWPEYTIYADHVIELKDGGALLDLANGQALCASHHRLKTIAVRARRLFGGVE